MEAEVAGEQRRGERRPQNQNGGEDPDGDLGEAHRSDTDHFAGQQIVGADVVEISPIAGQTVTEHLGARLIYKMISYMEHAKKNG